MTYFWFALAIGYAALTGAYLTRLALFGGFSWFLVWNLVWLSLCSLIVVNRINLKEKDHD